MTDTEVMAIMTALVRAGMTADDAEEVAEAMWRSERGLADESGRWLALAVETLALSGVPA